jgi:hypothetical protein
MAVTCLATAAWGLSLYVTYNRTVYWGYANSTHLYYYLHPVLYAVAAGSALVGVGSGLRPLRHPGPARGRRGTLALLLLTGLTLWACLSTLWARAYAV